MPSAVLHMYPVLSEFAYLKMMAVEILWSLNSHWASGGSSPVCKGVLDCESKKINAARKTYQNSNIPSKEKLFFAFMESFNKLHTYSMVCHPVGMHNNHFMDGDESLENKILMSVDIDSLSHK
jgi:hypothetical protein